MALDPLVPGDGPFADFDMVFAEAAQPIGGFDSTYLLVKRFLDVAAARATAEIKQRWTNRLVGIDVFAEDHVRTAALVHVRWND